jgi:hypothetical protein
MKKNMFAVAAAVLTIVVGSAHAGATGSQGSHDGESAYNVNKNSDSNWNRGGTIKNNTNNKSVTKNNMNNNSARNDSRVSASASADANASAGAESGADGGSGGGSSSVSAEGEDAPASSAAPVYITTTDDTCMGSSSVGGQADALGFSVASSWTDSSCITLKNARELKAQGHEKAARARLCMDEDNAIAFELAGEPCPRALASTQAALAKIRDAGPAYLASAQPSAQLAMLGEATGVKTSQTDGGDGTLLAMVQSAVQQVAAAFTAAQAESAPEPYTLYGIE